MFARPQTKAKGTTENNNNNNKQQQHQKEATKKQEVTTSFGRGLALVLRNCHFG
jgi:hypothetical protein